MLGGAVVALALAACGDGALRGDDVPELPVAADHAREAVELTRRAERFLAADAPEEAEPLLREALGKDPTNAEARRALGLLLARRGRSRDAVPILRGCLVDRPADVEVHRALTEALATIRDLAAAEAAYRAWLDVESGDADALAGLGRTLLARGDLEGALATLRRAEKRHPTSVAIRSDLGEALAAAGRLDDAERKQRDVVTRDASFAPGWKRLGDVILRRDPARGAEAATAYRRLLDLRARAGEALVALYGILRRAAAAGDAAAADEADRRWRAILRTFGPQQIARDEMRTTEDAVARERRLRARLAEAPADHDTRRTLAAQLRAEGVLDAAAVEYEHLVAAGAASALDLAAAGATHLEAGGVERAIELLTRAVQAGAPPPAPRQLAWALLVAGRTEDAIAAYGVAIERDPPDQASHAGRRLATLRR